MIDKYQKLPTFHFASEIKKRHNKKQLKCLIFGNFGAMNLGDEAILAGELQELKKIPNVTIMVVGRYPERVKKLHHVKAFSMYSWYLVRREIRKSDFVIVGGGGLINKIERNMIGFAYQLYMLATFFLLPRLYRKKLYILGVGIYSNANPFIVSLALPLLRNATMITVRDFHSYSFLKQKNVLGSLYKDNSFLMDLVSKQQVMNESFFAQNYRKDRMNIGISLVKPDNPKEEKRLIKELTAFIGTYAPKADFWLFPADCNPEYFNDQKFGEKLVEHVKKEVGSASVFHFVPQSLSPQLFFSAFALMDFIVAMRFHACVFAYRLKIPFAGISYDKKVESFLTSVGKESLSLKSFTEKDLSKSIL